ncbi:MAG: hypothetical protein ABH804_01365 [archaeon]
MSISYRELTEECKMSPNIAGYGREFEKALLEKDFPTASFLLRIINQKTGKNGDGHKLPSNRILNSALENLDYFENKKIF